MDAIGRQSSAVAGAVRFWREPLRSFQRSQNNFVGIRIFAPRVVHHIQTIKQLKELLPIFAKRQRPA